MYGVRLSPPPFPPRLDWRHPALKGGGITARLAAVPQRNGALDLITGVWSKSNSAGTTSVSVNSVGSVLGQTMTTPWDVNGQTTNIRWQTAWGGGSETIGTKYTVACISCTGKQQGGLTNVSAANATPAQAFGMGCGAGGGSFIWSGTGPSITGIGVAQSACLCVATKGSEASTTLRIMYVDLTNGRIAFNTAASPGTSTITQYVTNGGVGAGFTSQEFTAALFVGLQPTSLVDLLAWAADPWGLWYAS